MNLFRATLLCVSLMSFSSSIDAAVIFQDNFDSENAGVGANSFTEFTLWDILGSGDGGTVDLMGGGSGDIFPGNGLYVDLDGSSYIAGGLVSKASFDLVSGVTYTLSFSLAANYYDGPATKTVKVSIGTFSEDIDVSGSDGFTTITRNFTVAGPLSSTLSFASSNVGGASTAYGGVIDNVQLSDSTGVPEPSSFLLVLAGAPLFSRRIRKRLTGRG